MFSGIVDQTIRLVQKRPLKEGIRCFFTHPYSDLTLGESVAVNGVCLTVEFLEEQTFGVFISPETLSKTTFLSASEGSLWNIERALRVGDRLSGHFVLGHVDGLAQVVSVEKREDCWSVEVLPQDYPKRKTWLVEKGSIALDGVSLTINAVKKEGLEFMLIPHTLERTALKHWQVGTQVHVEYDYLAKLVTQQRPS